MSDDFNIIKDGFKPGNRLTLDGGELKAQPTKKAKGLHANMNLDALQAKIAQAALAPAEAHEVAQLIEARVENLESRLNSFWARVFNGRKITKLVKNLIKLADKVKTSATVALPQAAPLSAPNSQESSKTAVIPPPPVMAANAPPPPPLPNFNGAPPPPPMPGMAGGPAVVTKSKLHQKFTALGSPLEGEKLHGTKKVGDIQDIPTKQLAAFTHQLHVVCKIHGENIDKVGEAIETLNAVRADITLVAKKTDTRLKRLASAKAALTRKEDFEVSVADKSGSARILYYANRKPGTMDEEVQVAGGLADFVKGYPTVIIEGNGRHGGTNDLVTDLKKAQTTIKGLAQNLKIFMRTEEGKNVELLLQKLYKGVNALGKEAQELSKEKENIKEFRTQLTVFSKEMDKLKEIHTAYTKLVKAKKDALHPFKQASGLIEREGKLVPKTESKAGAAKTKETAPLTVKRGVARLSQANQTIYTRNPLGFVDQMAEDN